MVDAVSLFTGCGGSDAGVIESGFNVILANDMLRYAKDTYLANLPDTNFNLGCIENINSFPSAPLLIGCYPCQGFSQGGTRDPNRRVNRLYLEFARALEQIRPKAFVVENVSGMIRKNFQHLLQKQIKVFENKGYQLKYDVLNASDFGVSQDRKRIFIVGIRNDIDAEYRFPSPTHGNAMNYPKKTIKQAIGQMPKWPEGDFYDYDFHWYYLSRNRRRGWDGMSNPKPLSQTLDICPFIQLALN